MLRKHKNNIPSFSLLEILLLIALVGIAFVGVSNLLRQTLQLEGLAKNDFIANALADEGLALVKAMRLDNINYDAFGAPLDVWQDIAVTSTFPIMNPHYFVVDNDLKNLNPVAGTRPYPANDLPGAYRLDPAARLYFHDTVPAFKYYSHTDNAFPTNFYRMVIAIPEPYGGPTRFRVRVNVIVTLLYRGKTYTYNRTEILRDTQ